MAQLSSSHAFICIVVACGAFGYGFGFGVFVSSIGQPGFYVDLKLDPTSEYTAQSVIVIPLWHKLLAQHFTGFSVLPTACLRSVLQLGPLFRDGLLTGLVARNP